MFVRKRARANWGGAMARDIPETEWKEIQSRQAWRTERRQDKPNEVSSCLEKPVRVLDFPSG